MRFSIDLKTQSKTQVSIIQNFKTLMSNCDGRGHKSADFLQKYWYIFFDAYLYERIYIGIPNATRFFYFAFL